VNHGIKDWKALNLRLKTATEDDCLSILKSEKGGAKRKSWLVRIHHTLNKLRARRERAAL
jgi:hypothetical protein